MTDKFQVGEIDMIIKGKLIEIGDLEGGDGRGLRLDRDGDTIQITGLTKDECRTVVAAFGGYLSITISEIKGEQ